MSDEEKSEPPIFVRRAAEEHEEEEEKRRGGAALPAARAGSVVRGGGSAGAGGGAFGGAAGSAEVASAGGSAGGFVGKLLNPIRSLSAFFRQALALGPAEGLKFALRNTLVQGLLAGLLFAVAANFLIGPEAPVGKGAGGVPFPQQGSAQAVEPRGDGLYGSIPGIWQRAVAAFKGEPAPAEQTAEAAGAQAGKPAESADGKEPEEKAKDPAAEFGEGSASLGGAGRGKLEKVQGLFGQGSGGAGGGGAATLAALPSGSAAGRAGSGGGSSDASRAKTGASEAMKGRNKAPVRAGSRLGLAGARDAKDQLKNARVASQLGAGAANPQTGAAMSAMPFDGAAISGPGASSTPGGAIVPLPGSGSQGGGGQNSNLGGGNPTPGTNETGGRTSETTGGGTDGDDEGETTTTPPIGPVTNVTPYQALLNRAASLAAEGQRSIDSAQKYKWIAIGLFALAAVIAWGGVGMKRRTRNLATPLAAAREQAHSAYYTAVNSHPTFKQLNPTQFLANPTVQNIVNLDPSGPTAKMYALAQSAVRADNMAKDMAPQMDRAGDTADQGERGGFLARIGASIALAGIGMTFLGMYREGVSAGRDRLTEANEIANQIQDQYDQQEQAQIVRNAANRNCSVDGKPLVRNPAACGFRPDLDSRELVEFTRCMAPDTCQSRPGGASGNTTGGG